ncbi:MAG: TAXI family TRAP transporter solute-binding subunit [Pseudomonadales bacterium]|nr:TAXI family TRAP transporter solute-binding subunit [Pseudomonadales bacterium]
MVIKIILLTSLAVLFSTYSNAAKLVVSLGTGGITGVYYPTGGSICRIVNKPGAVHGIRCALEATDGSVSNIDRVQRGTLDVGIAQSNWVYHSYNTRRKNADIGSPSTAQKRPASDTQRIREISEPVNTSLEPANSAASLRTLLVLYPEYFTLIVPRHSSILKFDDIKGKRISMGTAGSSLRATMDDLLLKKGWTQADFSQVLKLDASEQASALCQGRIDVMIYTVGHPSAAAREATEDCDSRLVGVQGPEIEQLLAENSYYRWAKIPGAIYRGNIQSISTFGVNATLFTSTALSEETAYFLVKSLLENLAEFRTMHPAFTRLDPELMVKGPFAAPLHKGAIRYFKEIGLLP